MIYNSIKNKSCPIFLFLLIGYFILTLLNNIFILTEDLYYSSYGEQMALEKIENLFYFKTKWEWISYFFIPLTLIIKTAVITIILYTGVVLSNLKIGLNSIFRLVVHAEFIFLLMGFIKFSWIYFFQSDINFTKIGFFQPLSAINFFSPKDDLTYLVYPLQLINLFELAYWFILAYLLRSLLKKSFWKSFEFVLSTYGVSLVIWVVFVTFLTLNFGV